jgi:hypothetical protein
MRAWVTILTLIDNLPLKGLNSYSIIHPSIFNPILHHQFGKSISYNGSICAKNNRDVSLTPFSIVNPTFDNYNFGLLGNNNRSIFI